jgi:hypothetical protein
VLEIGTLARADANFAEPKLIPPKQRPNGTSIRRTGELDLAGASRMLGTRGLWAGPEIDGLKLAAVQQLEITTGYGRDSGVPPRITTGVELVYGEVQRRHPTADSLVIMESTAPLLFWWPRPGPTPEGYLAYTFSAGHMRVGGLNVALMRYRFSEGIDSILVAAAQAADAGSVAQ